MRGATGQQGGIHHLHLTAEGVVVNRFPDVVVAIYHHPRTAQMVGNVVVPTGRGAVGIQVHIAAVEPPQQRCVATQRQTVNILICSGLLYITVSFGNGHHMFT